MGDFFRNAAQSIVGDRSEGRPEDDFYPTPLNAVEALLRVEKFEGLIEEPACGDGAIVRPLERAGYEVVARDLFYHGCPGAEIGVDFLTFDGPKVPNIITNPPYKFATAFVEKALQRTTRKTAMLLKLVFLEGQGRTDLFDQKKLARVHVFRKRLKLTRRGEFYKGGGMICFAWFVWSHDHEGQPAIHWLRK